MNRRLIQAFGEKTFVYNRKIEGGTSSRRPDWYRKCAVVNLVIELDQKQHKAYDQDEETARLFDLARDFAGNKPLVVIRLNLDSFRDTDKNLIQSCVDNESNMSDRLAVLEKNVSRWLYTAEEPKRALIIERLFFDGYDAEQDSQPQLLRKRKRDETDGSSAAVSVRKFWRKFVQNSSSFEDARIMKVRGGDVTAGKWRKDLLFEKFNMDVEQEYEVGPKEFWAQNKKVFGNSIQFPPNARRFVDPNKMKRVRKRLIVLPNLSVLLNTLQSSES